MRRASLAAAAVAILGGMAARRIADVDLPVGVPVAGGFRSPPPHRRSSGTATKPYRAGGPVMEEGSRAGARRRRQIEAGQLKAENGLAREGD